MTKDTHVTEVVFRKFKDGQIIALFPHVPYNNSGLIDCYMHVGQHSGACYDGILGQTKLATPIEMLPLYTELESIGYNLLVIKRRNYDKFLKNYRNLSK